MRMFLRLIVSILDDAVEFLLSLHRFARASMPSFSIPSMVSRISSVAELVAAQPFSSGPLFLSFPFPFPFASRLAAASLFRRIRSRMRRPHVLSLDGGPNAEADEEEEEKTSEGFPPALVSAMMAPSTTVPLCFVPASARPSAVPANSAARLSSDVNV